ncbi:ABC transporter substrate-binding protein [Desulfobotulus sp. H1]|uniref:ABC transporter substrate-binding protein n=1 Tax=Desulfobotulus pelophilus TaxID=2823377 RepID=A0ABT3NCF9_9BACT|nr:ABC transporter substrate-binding protein [Desulfobotulus pelophilus]MCW7755137.1 ABC transporter substrate-binding protein [Desulfobotulus pelophilus]
MILQKMRSWKKNAFVLVCSLFCVASSGLVRADDNPELIIGLSLPLSGQGAVHARKWLHGIQAAVENVNSEGGVHGHILRVLPLDDGGAAVRRSENLLTLTEQEEVFALVGAYGADGAADALLRAEESGVLLFGSNSGLQSLTNPVKSNVFNLRPDTETEMRILVDRFINETGRSKIAVFHTENTYGEEAELGVRKALEQKGLEPQAVFSVPAASAVPAIAPAVAAMMESWPDAVIIAADKDTTAAFVRLVREHTGETVLIVAAQDDPIELASILMNRGLGVVISETVPFPFYRRIPVVSAYASAVEIFKQDDPSIEMSFPGFEGYLNARVFIHILQQSPALTTEAFITTASKQTETDLGGFRFTFSDQRRIGSGQVYLTQIAPGGFVTPIRTFSEMYEFHP